MNFLVMILIFCAGFFIGSYCTYRGEQIVVTEIPSQIDLEEWR